MKLSIIIPVFNEEQTIEQVIAQVKKSNTLNYDKEIIVINDGSNDNSRQILEQIKDIILINHDRNKGKAIAIKTGLNYVQGDLLIIQDADLEYSPDDYKILINGFNQYKTVIYGSRKQKGYFHYFLGVRILSFITNLLYLSNLKDIYTCYKLIPANIIKSINIESRGFEFEAEITVKILKKGIKIKEIPINYYPRKFKEGKKIRFRDALTGLWTIIKNRV